MINRHTKPAPVRPTREAIQIIILFVLLCLLVMLSIDPPPLWWSPDGGNPVDTIRDPYCLRYHGADMMEVGWRGEISAYKFNRDTGKYELMWRRM